MIKESSCLDWPAAEDGLEGGRGCCLPVCTGAECSGELGAGP